MSFDNIPEELRALNQWVCWRAELRDGKVTKVPYQARKRGHVKASSTGTDTWSSFDHAQRRIAEYRDMDGIGFVFSATDPYLGIDLDDIEGEDSLGIESFIDRSGTYAEVSPSGTGIHLIGRAGIPHNDTGTGRRTKGIEVYQHGRYFTMTGNALDGEIRPIRDIQPIVNEFWSQWFPQKEEIEPISTPISPIFASDEDILQKIRGSKQESKFTRLWNGDISEYGGDDSAADLGLLSILSFWTQDRDQISRIFGASALAQRKKWQDRASYRESSITKALQRSEFYTPRPIYDEGVANVTIKLPFGGESTVTTFRRTDDGNALRLLHHFGDSIRHNHEELGWLIWNGTHWEPDTREQIHLIAREAGAMIRDEADAIATADEKLGKALHKWADSTENQGRRKAMIESSRPHVAISLSELDTNPMLLNTASGTIDLETGRLRPHRREEYMTRLSEVTFNPNAPCPIWERFIHTIFGGDQDLISYIQRAIGYSMTGDVTERAMFILYGKGRNGKSTLVETISRILGTYARASSTDLIIAPKGDRKVPRDLANLPGIRFTYTSETGEHSNMDEAQIKSITGGDRTDAYQPHGKSFNLDPQFKLWLSTNHRPTIRGGDDGIWDRLHLIPFSVRIPDADVDRYLRTKLLNESSGILNWMIQGALAWRREGLGTAVSVHRATREYRSAMDSVGAFLDEACVLDIPSVISVSDFYIAYESWAKSSGERALPKRILTNRMRDREFVIEPQGKRNVLCIHGVRLPFPSEEMTKPTPISRYAAS